MERLTKRNAWGEVVVSGKGEKDLRNKFMAIAERLAELEDKLESGQLVELPCKVGDFIYWINPDLATEIERVKITSFGFNPTHNELFIVDEHGYEIYKCEFGENAFTDKVQAEACLKELKRVL